MQTKRRNEKRSDIQSLLSFHDGGADEDRTRDLLLAKQALSQLSYSPKTLYDYSNLASKNQLFFKEKRRKSYNDEKREKERGKTNLIADFFDFHFDELFSDIYKRRNLKTEIVF